MRLCVVRRSALVAALLGLCIAGCATKVTRMDDG